MNNNQYRYNNNYQNKNKHTLKLQKNIHKQMQQQKQSISSYNKQKENNSSNQRARSNSQTYMDAQLSYSQQGSLIPLQPPKKDIPNKNNSILINNNKKTTNNKNSVNILSHPHQSSRSNSSYRIKYSPLYKISLILFFFMLACISWYNFISWWWKIVAHRDGHAREVRDQLMRTRSRINNKQQYNKLILVGSTVNTYSTTTNNNKQSSTNIDNNQQIISQFINSDLTSQLQIETRRTLLQTINTNTNKTVYYKKLENDHTVNAGLDLLIADNDVNAYERMSYATERRVRLNQPHRQSISHGNGNIIHMWKIVPNNPTHRANNHNQSKININSVNSNKKVKICLIMNADNSIITYQSLLTVRLYILSGLVQCAIIIGGNEERQRKLIYEVFANKNYSNASVNISSKQYPSNTNQSNLKPHSHSYTITSHKNLLDSDYIFLTDLIPSTQCNKLIYISNHFGVNDQMLENIRIELRLHEEYGVTYSRQCYYDSGRNGSNQNKKNSRLTLLHQYDLSIVPDTHYKQYLYIIDPILYKYTTPLSFAYYTKYTIQQILILPILALTQLSKKLTPSLSHNLHSINMYNKLITSNRQYAMQGIKGNIKEKNSLCFVSVPCLVDKIGVRELQRYLDGIMWMDDKEAKEKLQIQDNIKISIVVYLPYNFVTKKQPSVDANIIILLKKYEKYLLKQSSSSISQSLSPIQRLHIRFLHKKAFPSHAAYQSTYLYCPNKALIITSRHNIVFYPSFGRIVLANVRQQFHYITVHLKNKRQPSYKDPFSNKLNHNYQYLKFSKTDPFIAPSTKILTTKTIKKSVLKPSQPTNPLPYVYHKQPFRNSTQFIQYFQYVQIFKSDFMKTNIFWILKSSELEFYQTEACFVTIMMEEVEGRVGDIQKILGEVYERDYSQIELRQIGYINTYAEYSPLIENKLMPYKYHCLQNPTFKRHAPKIIPHKLHQIWLSKDSITPLRNKLQQTLKDINPTFTAKLWTYTDLTKQNFPLTFALVQRTLQYNKNSQYSMLALVADLLRYEILYNQGGIYVDFKMEGKKSLEPFLKYQIFFIDCDISDIRFKHPQAIGVGVMGSTINNYYLKIILTQLIRQRSFDYQQNIPHISGGFVARKSLSDYQFFNILGLGNHLLFPKPYDYPVNQCGGIDKKFEKNQEVFQVTNAENITVKIGIPCKEYPEAYLISYTPLARTWLSSKNKNIAKL